MNKDVLAITEVELRYRPNSRKVYTGAFMLTKSADSALQPQFETSKPEIASHLKNRASLFQHTWPITVIIFSLIVTIAWVCVLSYGAFQIGALLF